MLRLTNFPLVGSLSFYPHHNLQSCYVILNYLSSNISLFVCLLCGACVPSYIPLPAHCVELLSCSLQWNKQPKLNSICQAWVDDTAYLHISRHIRCCPLITLAYVLVVSIEIWVCKSENSKFTANKIDFWSNWF